MIDMAPIMLGIVADDAGTRSNLEQQLSAQPDFALRFSCGSLAEALAAIEGEVPDIVLVDIQLPDGTGLDFVKAFQAKGAGRAVILSALGERTTVLLAFDRAASGFSLKDAPVDTLARDIRALMAGGTPTPPPVLAMGQVAPAPPACTAAERRLTPRELDVLTMFSRGLSYRETAHTLVLSPHTVSDHVKAIYSKLAVHSRNEAVFEAVQNGWLQL